MIQNLTDEVRYRLLKYLAEHPGCSQRDLARDLGVSLGKANYCLRALVAKGLIKVRNFKNSKKKSAYAYVLTPKGMEEKLEVTYAFLRRKIAEFDLISKEIEGLKIEIEGRDASIAKS